MPVYCPRLGFARAIFRNCAILYPILMFCLQSFTDSAFKRRFAKLFVGLQIIAKLKEMSKTQYVSSYRLANLYGDLGEKDQAFSALERSYEEQEWDITRVKVDPFLDPLRDDPRFAAILKRLNLPE